jgi:hypothetical protein
VRGGLPDLLTCGKIRHTGNRIVHCDRPESVSALVEVAGAIGEMSPAGDPWPAAGRARTLYRHNRPPISVAQVLAAQVLAAQVLAAQVLAAQVLAAQVLMTLP